MKKAQIEKTEKKRKSVLIVNTVPFNKGGISTVIMNYYLNINIQKFNIDFVINREIDSDYKECILEKGANIFILNRNRNLIKYAGSLYKIMKKNKYDIIHIHGNSATMLIDILPAMASKIKCRIVHCHNTECNHPNISKVFNILFKRTYTKALACSEAAGNWLFGKGNFEVLPNGIDMKQYRFSEIIRNEVRKELDLSDKFVVGHVGFMNEQKNHEKLFSVFNELKKVKSNVHLLCVTGNEEIPGHLVKLIEEYKIKNQITVLFQRSDVNRIMQAMDIFVFPSRWEGFGIVLLEAQAAGLPCVVSDQCIKEINLINQMKYVPLEGENHEWVKNILEIYNSNIDREKCNEILCGGIYDIKNCIDNLERIY